MVVEVALILSGLLQGSSSLGLGLPLGLQRGREKSDSIVGDVKCEGQGGTNLDGIDFVQTLGLDELVDLGTGEAGQDLKGKCVVLGLAVGSYVLLVSSQSGKGLEE